MLNRLSSRLYLRIWLGVVLAIVILTLAVGWVWRMNAEDRPLPLREVVVRNEAGQVIGRAQSAADRQLGDELRFSFATSDGRMLDLQLPRPERPGGPRRNRLPFEFFWMLGLIGLAVAAGAYPVIRRLTQRLESLQRGVERWGSGDLSARMVVQGRDEVAFLAERFNHAAQRIETLMETQKSLLVSHKSLLANASHELRSPLARIRMALELMKTRSDTPETSPVKAEIFRSIQELDQLIDEILLASRLDAREPDAEAFEALDLTGLAAEECARVQANLELGANSHSLTVQGSARLLRRLIRNLLENARRYSAGQIDLELSQSGSGAQQRAVIRVNDRGPGVPPEQRERIFEPFYRLPGASEREGGVGLGLALVKSIAERHGGTVRCESRSGGGASFVVEIPVAGTGRSNS
jgi:signal transduction histidine kinase